MNPLLCWSILADRAVMSNTKILATGIGSNKDQLCQSETEMDDCILFFGFTAKRPFLWVKDTIEKDAQGLDNDSRRCPCPFLNHSPRQAGQIRGERQEMQQPCQLKAALKLDVLAKTC